MSQGDREEEGTGGGKEEGRETYLKISVILGDDILRIQGAMWEGRSTVLELDEELAGIYPPHCSER